VQKGFFQLSFLRTNVNALWRVVTAKSPELYHQIWSIPPPGAPYYLGEKNIPSLLLSPNTISS